LADYGGARGGAWYPASSNQRIEDCCRIRTKTAIGHAI